MSKAQNPFITLSLVNPDKPEYDTNMHVRVHTIVFIAEASKADKAQREECNAVIQTFGSGAFLVREGAMRIRELIEDAERENEFDLGEADDQL